MSRPIKKGTTNVSTIVRIIDSTSGLPETAVEHNTSGIDLWYRRESGLKVTITPAALNALNSAHSDGGIEHIGDGYYRLDLPDAVCAVGANGVQIGGTVTGMVVIGNYLPLVSYDPNSATNLGLSKITDIDGKTTNLPDDPADASDLLALFAALENVSVADILAGLADGVAISTILTRLNAFAKGNLARSGTAAARRLRFKKEDDETDAIDVTINENTNVRSQT